MKSAIMTPCLLAALLLTAPWAPAAENPPGAFRQPDAKACPNLFLWTDTCNVYVLRNGESAMLIDLGDGSVLDHLADIGVKRVEWILFTHHHREQCQGYPRLKAWQAKLAAPEAERALFEKPADFRKMNVRLGDRFTIHGASYVRPPIHPIPLDKTFASMDTFTWHGHEFWCLDTRGNSPGGMSYLLKESGRWIAFSGDLMLDGATLHNWFDHEWDYGFAAGIHATANSAALLAGFDPARLFPSHGPAITQPAKQFAQFEQKLIRLEKLLVRGYPVQGFSSTVQDRVSRPSVVPHLWQVSPHIYKFRGPNLFPNFYLILSDAGRALVVDCGLLDEKLLARTLEQMQEKLGLKQIDAVIVTHMHGDHFLQVPFLKQRWGAKAWAIDRMGPVCENPEWFDYAAPIQAYGAGFDRLKFDRLFKDGETFDWEGIKFTVDWMPGQTEFALCLHATIDGRKVAFTGDNLFGDPQDPQQTGHEAVVAHNSAVLEEGYIQAAEYLTKLKPDILLGGHSYVMDHPADFIERFRKWSYEMRDAFRGLCPTDEYRTWYDPYWVRVEPYRVRLAPGESADITLHIRNFRDRPQSHRIEIHTPPGMAADPPIIAVDLPKDTRRGFPLRLRADADASPGVKIVALDITLDGHRLGELFDFVVEMKPGK